MNMVDVNNQLANVAQIVRKCPTTTLRRAYVHAMREWCYQTRWLRTNVAGATAANTAQYALGNDPNLEIVGVQAMQGSQASGSGTQYWSIAPSGSENWSANVPPGVPVRFQYVPEAQFALNPTPDDVYGLLLTLVLQPKEGAVNVPESPLVKYGTVFEAGALAYLLNITGQPWTNPRQAADHAKAFSAGIANGKSDVQRSFNAGSQRMRPRAFVI